MQPLSPKSRMPWELHSTGAGRGLGTAARERKGLYGILLIVQALSVKARAMALQLFQTLSA